MLAGTGGAVNASAVPGCPRAVEDSRAIAITQAVTKYRKKSVISCPFITFVVLAVMASAQLTFPAPSGRDLPDSGRGEAARVSMPLRKAGSDSSGRAPCLVGFTKLLPLSVHAKPGAV